MKVWNAARTVRKSLVVSSYDELQRKGRDKLGLGKVEPVRIVTEADGTQVDDPDYFGVLPDNSVFLFLRPGEIWHPVTTDSVKAGESYSSAIFSRTRRKSARLSRST